MQQTWTDAASLLSMVNNADAALAEDMATVVLWLDPSLFTHIPFRVRSCSKVWKTAVGLSVYNFAHLPKRLQRSSKLALNILEAAKASE